jgi:hypothetical protein
MYKHNLFLKYTIMYYIFVLNKLILFKKFIKINK